MPSFHQVSRPKTFTIGTPSYTCPDLVDMKLEIGAESTKHYGHKRFPFPIIKNDMTKLTVTTTDRALYVALNKDEIVTTVTAVWQTVDTALNGATMAASGAADSQTFTCTDMMVDEIIPLEGKANGDPVEFTVVLIPCQNAATGAAPTIAVTHASLS